MPASAPQHFLDAAASYGLAFDGGDLDRFARYLSLLLEVNKSFNLTAITDLEQAWMRHVFDSLTLLPFIVESKATRIIDIGSGGGAPGIPLAIALPDVQFTLLESTGKKVRFLRDAVDSLELHNTTVIEGRAETIAHDRDTHREVYDIATARAVGPLRVLLELTLPFVKVGGLVLAVKGERAAEEIADAKKALHQLHGNIAGTHRTPTGTIVIIEKARPTPKLYPRRPGEPKRAPL